MGDLGYGGGRIISRISFRADAANRLDTLTITVQELAQHTDQRINALIVAGRQTGERLNARLIGVVGDLIRNRPSL